MWLLCIILFAFSDGLIVNNFGWDSPTLLMRSQWSSFDVSAFNQNYSLVSVAGCFDSPLIRGKVQWMNAYVLPCTGADAVAQAINNGAVGVYFGLFNADFFTMAGWDGFRPMSSHPCF